MKTGEIIKKYRKQIGLTQLQLAKVLGVSQPKIAQLEAAEEVSFSVIKDIAEKTGGDALKLWSERYGDEKQRFNQIRDRVLEILSVMYGYSRSGEVSTKTTDGEEVGINYRVYDNYDQTPFILEDQDIEDTTEAVIQFIQQTIGRIKNESSETDYIFQFVKEWATKKINR